MGNKRAPFPLTPVLSLGERGNRRQIVREADAVRQRGRRRQSPPLPKGEDRGEGEAAAATRSAEFIPLEWPTADRTRSGINSALRLLLSIALAILLAQSSFAAEPPLVITRETDDLGFPKPVPVHVSGFTGEVDGALKNDLRFMGIVHSTPDEAKFLVTGNNSGVLEGRLIEKVTRNQILGRRYSGGNLRAQTHRFADEIAEALGRGPGIAQTRIAFKVETAPGTTEIYIADYDGFGAQAVTPDRSIAAAPSWAGRSTLYYYSYKLGGVNIFSHHLQSGARKLITPYSGSNISPAVSPDGKRLAMILSKGGSPDLYVSNLDGSGLKQLTRTGPEESSPCWSPDSQTICYVSKASGVNQLYTISAEGGSPARVRTVGVSNCTEPDWSPDGKWIVFTSLARDFRVCLVSAAGGEAQVLATGEDPSWASNSRAVMFVRRVNHTKVLSLLDVPTKHVKDVPRILGSNSQPSWAR